jgi:lipopolysaccharide biosynthesis glycosyltransferase
MRFSVAFCGDRNMEAPLHVAASSLLSHIASGWTIDFYFILSGYDQQHRDRLLQTLELTKVGNFKAHFLSPPPDNTFTGMPSLHGDLTTYYRLVLPNLIEADRLLYVDCDTISFLDVSPLATIEMPYLSGFVGNGDVNDQPERAFFSRLGLAPNTPALNAGVMLFDAAAWRATKHTETMLDFCRRHGENLLCCDQTALIATSAGTFTRLEQKYNLHMYPTTPVPDPSRLPGIYHFVGSPKPWDPAGRSIHPGFALYQRALANTVFRTHRSGYARLSYWKRAYKIKGGYFRTFRTMLRQKKIGSPLKTDE